MNKKISFICLNALMVLVIGLTIGIAFSKHIFAAQLSTTAFSLLLVVLFIPSIVAAFNDKIMLGTKISVSLFFAVEIIGNIVFIIYNNASVKAYAIFQLVSCILILVTLMIIVLLFKDNEYLSSSKKTKE